MRKPRRHAGERDLIEALGRSGCPICRLAAEAVEAFLASVCYEQVNDLDLRAELRAAGGFCREHAGRFLRQPNGPLATAIVYRDVLANAARRLEQADPGGRSRLAGLLAKAPRRPTAAGDAGRCPACGVLAEATARHLGALRARLGEPAVQDRYRAADGLCLRHLDQALESDDDGARFLAGTAVVKLGSLVGELDSYIRKHDYRFRGEAWAGEEDAPARAIERAVGCSEPEA